MSEAEQSHPAPCNSRVSQEGDEDHRRITLAATQTGTFEVQLETSEFTWSGAFRQLLDLGEDLEPSYELFLSRIHPADRGKLDSNVVDDPAFAPPEFVEEFRVDLPEQEVRWLLFQGRLLHGPDGGAQRLIGTLVDITPYKDVTWLLSRRAAQQQAVCQLGRQALTNPDFELLLDRAVESVSRELGVGFATVLQLLPDSPDLSLQTASGFSEDLTGLKVSSSAGSYFQEALESQAPAIAGQSGLDQGFPASLLGGDLHLASSIAVPISGQGQPWGLLTAHSQEPALFCAHDIAFLEAVTNVLAQAHARRQSEQKLQVAHDELEARIAERTAQLLAVNEELEAFVYSVSHDLRAPLRSVSGFSQVLLEDYSTKLDETAGKYLQRITNAARRMDDLIEDLLLLSRITSSTLQRRTANLTRKVTELSEELTSREPHRKVQFDIQPSLEARADPRLVRIVLENLVENAWKFTRLEEEANFSFGQTPQADGGEFFIRDNGVGFDMSQAARVFAPFEQLHSPDQFAGSGIGLATVERIIHKHEGTVRLVSAPGEGTTVYFNFGTAS